MLRDRLFLTGAGAASSAQWNPLDKPTTITLSNGNLTATNSAFGNARATSSVITAGKYYWEMSVDNLAGNTMGGVMQQFSSLSTGVVGDASGDVGIRFDGGSVVEANTTRKSGAGAFVNGDICMIAINVATRQIWFGRNGSWLYSGDPVAGTNEAYTFANARMYPAVSFNNFAGGVTSARFSSFFMSYPVPSGFSIVP